MADALLRFTAVKGSTRASQVIADQTNLVRAMGVGGTGASGSSDRCLDTLLGDKCHWEEKDVLRARNWKKIQPRELFEDIKKNCL